MASWAQVEAEVPELAAAARRAFDRHVHKTLATLRRDGSPRISGTELEFEQGEVWFGSMPGSVKTTDLRRDPRFAVHSALEDPPAPGLPSERVGDAKLAGVAEEVTDLAARARVYGEDFAEGKATMFRAEIAELVLIRVAGDPPDHLLVSSWHQGRGLSELKRK